MTIGGVLRVKKGAKFDTIAPGGFRILTALDGTARVLGIDLTITAGTNDHTTGRHPFGEAFDVSVQDMTPTTILKVKRSLEQILGDAFTVLYEVPEAPADTKLAAIAHVNEKASAAHVHIQVRRGTEYPPLTMSGLLA